MSEQADLHKGKISRAYVFRCLDCEYCASYEWNLTERFMTLDYAMYHARKDGWSKTKDGWKCSACKARKSGDISQLAYDMSQ